MRVYVPFWGEWFDVLEWASKLGSQKTLHCTHVIEKGFNTVAALTAHRALLQTMFRSVDVLSWSEDAVIENATCAASRHAYLNNNGEPWFFWELNHIPLHKGWLDQIRDAYWTKSQQSLGIAARPLTPGHGVYGPLTWPKLKLLGKEAKFDARPDVFQSLNEPLYGWDDLSKKVDFTCATLWSNSSNTLDILLNHRNSTAVNVPNHLPMELTEPVQESVPGTVDILYVTFAKDFEWLDLSLRSLKKFATGFRQIVVAVPEGDAQALAPIVAPYGTDVRVIAYQDTPGKGFLVHAEKICSADLLSNADYLFHMDSDCVMKTANHPGHYFKDGKPILVYRSYESLKSADGKAVSDCYQWKAVSEATLGMPIDVFSMTRHPHVYPRTLYRPFRDHVEKVQRMPFHDYVISCKNSFPQSYAEHPSLGGFAWVKMPELFSWVNCEISAPRDLIKNFWSHGGTNQHVGAHWHDAQAIGPLAKKDVTAKQLIESWLE